MKRSQVSPELTIAKKYALKTGTTDELIATFMEF